MTEIIVGIGQGRGGKFFQRWRTPDLPAPTVIGCPPSNRADADDGAAGWILVELTDDD